jgi:protein-L-isoaspartate O-methyltransferase
MEKLLKSLMKQKVFHSEKVYAAMLQVDRAEFCESKNAYSDE